MSMVSLTIDGKNVTVPAGTTILEAAKAANIRIPTLCYLPEVQAIGACRVCLVEIEGNRSLQASCVFPAAEGLVVHTNSQKVQQARKFTVELLLSAHPQDCLICVEEPQMRTAEAGRGAGDPGNPVPGRKTQAPDR